MALTDLILGSPMALSMTGIPQLIIAGVAGGVAVTVAASVYTYKKIEGKWIEKKRGEIDDINKLHRKYLDKIEVPGIGVIQGFPQPFKLSEDKNTFQVDSMHYTDEQMEAVGKMLPYCVDISLSAYRENVLSAILKLKDYYFSRSNHSDTTSGVICYLVNMLETKCLHFSGYQYDIAYLDAITDFINAYASMDGHTNSQHFSRLEPIYSYLQQAQHDLERHRESLTLEELIKELRDTCSNEAKRFLRIFLKMTSPLEQWPLIENVAMDEVSNGLLRRHYTSKQLAGIVFKKDHEVQVTESVFKYWAIDLAKFYLKSLSPIDGAKTSKLPTPDELFAFVNYAKAFDLKELQKYQKTREAEIFSNKMSEIRGVFYYSQNFITTKLEGSFNKFTFVNIHKNVELIQRTEVLSNFARIVHAIISLQYLCTHLLKSIKQLGDIYVKDPNHFHEIFIVLSNLCSVIKKNIGQCRAIVMDIQEANLNSMRLEKQELFPEEVKDALENTREVIAKLGNQVKEYRDELSETPKDTQERVIYDMMSVANLLVKMYPIDLNKTPKQKDPNKQSKDKPQPTPKQPTEPKEPQPTPKVLSSEDTLNELIPVIKSFHQEEHVTTSYQKIWDSLHDVLLKAKSIEEESHASPDRLEKAQKVKELVDSLIRQFSGFLTLNDKERQERASEFVKGIHQEIAKPDFKEAIDAHSNKATEYCYEHLCHWGVFNTNTRKKIEVLESAYDNLLENS